MTVRKKSLLSLLPVLILTAAITALGIPLRSVSILWLRRLLNCGLYVLLLLPSAAAYRMAGHTFGDLFADKSGRQYGWALTLLLVLSIPLALLPALMGFSIIGDALAFDLGTLLYYAVFYLLFVGPVEEFIFRVYVQETLEGCLTRYTWLAPLLCAVLFGLWHWLSGSWVQAIFTMGIGLVFSYAKYLGKHCTYLSVALGHGLYDFFNVVIRMFVI